MRLPFSSSFIHRSGHIRLDLLFSIQYLIRFNSHRTRLGSLRSVIKLHRKVFYFFFFALLLVVYYDLEYDINNKLEKKCVL